MEPKMRRDLFLKDYYGNEYEAEVVKWYVRNYSLIDSYPNKGVMKAVIDAFIADCNLYALMVVENHEEWRSLNQQAIENARRRVDLLLEDWENKKAIQSLPPTSKKRDY
jgi:hypothetical protein